MLNMAYEILNELISGYNRMDNLLDRAGFSEKYDKENEIITRTKGKHKIIIDGSSVSYIGPFGDMHDLDFKEMTEFFINQKRV